MMLRIGRYARTLLAIVMVVLWLALIAIWIRSYWRGDQMTMRIVTPVEDRKYMREYLVLSGDGGVCLATRAQWIAWNDNYNRPNWTVANNPNYPRPWAVVMRGVLRLSGTSIIRTPTTMTSVNFTASAGTLSITPPIVASTTSGSSVSSATLSNAGTMTLTMQSTSGSIVSSSVTTMVMPPSNGTVVVATGNGPTASPAVWNFNLSNMLTSLPAPENPPTGNFHFIAYRAGQPQQPTGRAYVLIMPYWAVLLAMTVPVILSLRSESHARRRRFRLRNNLCVNCGYDLRATTDRCPECGNPSSVKQL